MLINKTESGGESLGAEQQRNVGDKAESPGQLRKKHESWEELGRPWLNGPSASKNK